jgi:hypothetical protein
VAQVVHPIHRANGHGFVLDGDWLQKFWTTLASQGSGVRAQVHTHPYRAFHSPTDDEWPIVSSDGFLSLVIPDFAQGRVGLERAYLTELVSALGWQEVRPVTKRLEIV